MIFTANNFCFFSNKVNFNYGEISSIYNNSVLVSVNLKNDFFFNQKQYRSFFFKYGSLNVFLPFFFQGLDYYWTNRINYFYPLKALRWLALKNSYLYIIDQIKQKFQLNRSSIFLLSIFRKFYRYTPGINFLSQSKSLFFLKNTNVNVSFVKFIAKCVYKPLLVRSKYGRFNDRRGFFEFTFYKDQYLIYKRYYKRLFKMKFRKIRAKIFSIKRNNVFKAFFRRNILIRRLQDSNT